MLGGPYRATITTTQELFALVPEQDLALALNAMRPLYKGEATSYSVEHRVLRHDGTAIWIQSEGRIAEGEAGKHARRVVGTNRDITERREAQDELRRISSLLVSVLDAATEVAVVCVDKDDRVTVFNKGAERMLGYSSDEVVGRLSAGLFLDPLEVQTRQQEASKEQGRSLPTLDALTHETAQGKTREWTYIRKDGSRLPVALVITEVRSLTGDLLGYLSTAHDITQQKEQERNLKAARDSAEQTAQAKAAFLANMSHEIRTPMNGVIGMTSLLLDTPLSSEQREFTEIIRRSGEGLLVVINDILDYSKIEAGQMEMEFLPFSLKEAVESSIELLAQKAQEKRLDLLYMIDADVPGSIFGDFARLRQVLVNLISNALKFTEQGEVFLHVRKLMRESSQASADGDEPAFSLEFSIRDTGIGIPADKLPRLFQAFSQADSSTSRKYGGTGLGLAISRLLVEAMRGSMAVHSEEGQGATFSFTMETAQAPETADASSIDFSHLAGKKALLVDDNATSLHAMGLQIERWGMQHQSCRSAEEALSILGSGSYFDLLISDLHMPDMDGIALCRAVRATRPILPLILLSSSNVRQDDQPGLFNAILAKPARESSLLRTLAQVLPGIRSPSSVAPVFPSQFDSNLAGQFPLRILLAEDNEINRLVALRVLKGFGYQADVAANGIEAVDAVKRQPYHLVLMDIQMPEMDGIDATRLIITGRKADGFPRVVGMSANAMREDTAAALQAGMDDYIVKPFAVANLREKIVAVGELLRPSDSMGDTAPHTSGTAIPPHALLDLKQVNSLIALDPKGDLARRLLASFALQKDGLIQHLQRGVTCCDLGSVSHSAHQLKGVAGTLGMSALAELAAEMDACTRSQDWHRLSNIIKLAMSCSEDSFEALKTAFAAASDPC